MKKLRKKMLSALAITLCASLTLSSQIVLSAAALETSTEKEESLTTDNKETESYEEKGNDDDFVLPAIVSEQEAKENGYVSRDKDSEDNLYTFVFKNADGTGTMKLYSHPVKYVDSEDKIRDITLEVKEDGNGGFVSADHYISTQFPHDFSEGIALEYDGINLRMTPEKAGKNITAEKTGSSITYSADDNTDYVYTLTYEGFKEDIVVSEYTGQTDYSFIIDTAGLAVSEINGAYYFTDDKENIMGAVGDILVYSADEKNNTTGKMVCEELMPNEQYRLTLHVDNEYLSSEDTVYPIRIDPSININYTNNGEGAIQDVTVYSNNTFNGTGSDLVVGRKNGLKARTLMKFPGLSFTNIHSSLNITSASVEMIDCKHQNESVRVYCYMYGGNSWSESSASWSSTEKNYQLLKLDSLNVTNNTTHKFNFDISGAVKCWVDGSVSKNLGILFKASNSLESGSSDKYKDFASYDRFTLKPSLKVVFTYGVVRNQFYSKYDPEKFNTNVIPSIGSHSSLIRYRMNCYGYAFCNILNGSAEINAQGGYKQQPGEFALANNTLVSPLSIQSSDLSDGFEGLSNKMMAKISNNILLDSERLANYTITEYVQTSSSISQYGSSSRLIAVVVGCNREFDPIAMQYNYSWDYHFYMQHSDGTWSHKPGSSNITNKSISSNVILTNNNIASKANEGFYENGSLKFFIITKKAIYDSLFTSHCCYKAPRCPDHSINVNSVASETAGDYLETCRYLTVNSLNGKLDFKKDHDVFCYQMATGRNYTITAGNANIAVYNADGVKINPVSNTTNTYFLNGGLTYYIDVYFDNSSVDYYTYTLNLL